MIKRKKKSHVSIEINDYVLRALVMKGSDFSEAKVYEVALPSGILEESSILDELELFGILKANAKKWGGKKQKVRFFVPDPTVLLKTFSHPTDIEPTKLKEYVQMELGQSIHLPFQDAILDVYDPKEDDGQAIIFATSSEEVRKYFDLFSDIHMHPEAADIRALCNLRLLEHMKLLDVDKTYLIANWLINELSICIYSNGHVDFLRYQPIPTDMQQWSSTPVNDDEFKFTFDGELEDYRMIVSDQVLELDRIMNFFRFSLHKGEKAVDEIIAMGDNPIIEHIYDFLQNNLAVPIQLITDELINEHFNGFKAKHATLIGLALKEVH